MWRTTRAFGMFLGRVVVVRAGVIASVLAAAGATPADTSTRAADPGTDSRPVKLEALGTIGIRNAEVVPVDVETGLEATIAELVRTAPDPAWIGYLVPSVVRDRSVCCGGGRSSGFGSCGLERDNEWFGHRDDPSGAVGSRDLAVLLRVSNGAVRRIHGFTDDCRLDGSGLTLFELRDVDSAQSARYVERLVRELRHGDSALATLALHDDAVVDPILGSMIGKDEPRSLRREAAFWLGEARGRRGYELLVRELDTSTDASWREHLVFAVAISDEPAGVDRLIRLARRDPDADVRGQALFWLAERAADRAEAVLHGALRDDPEVDVKKEAVFGLSQLPRDRAIPALIRVADSDAHPEVRRAAMFWLGQTRDARAVVYFESLLGSSRR